MAFKRLIIHPDNLRQRLKDNSISLKERDNLNTALGVIGDVLKNANHLVIVEDQPAKPGILHFQRKVLGGDVYLLKSDDVIFLASCVEKSDVVELYGGDRGICIRIAHDDLKPLVSRVLISEKGCA